MFPLLFQPTLLKIANYPSIFLLCFIFPHSTYHWLKYSIFYFFISSLPILECKLHKDRNFIHFVYCCIHST